MESTDKNGSSVIGWMWLENNINLSVLLVEEGFAAVHFTAEKSEYFRILKAAEDQAKLAKKNRWANWVEPDPAEIAKDQEGQDGYEKEKDDKAPADRKTKMENILVTEVLPTLNFYAQHTDSGPKLELLMSKLRQELKSSPPVPGSYTPRRGDLCAAKFSEDEEWYRAKIESVSGGGKATVRYIDYGNSEVNFLTLFDASSLDPHPSSIGSA